MWPWSRKPKKQEGFTKGGSRIIKHGGSEFDKPQFGVPDKASVDFARQREVVYDTIFGKCAQVWHELPSMIPHVDVYQFDPGNSGREFYTFVTSGMSDQRMMLPNDVGSKAARAELIFYCGKPKRDYNELLRRLAHFPHDNKTWLAAGHTMPNGTPPQLMFGSKVLDTLLFIPTIVGPDKELPDRLRLDGDPVNLLWVVPITTAECELKLNDGIGGLLDLFTKFDHPFVFSGDRRSYA